MDTASGSDVPIIADNIEDVVMNSVSQGLTASTSNTSNTSTSTHYSCFEEPLVTQQILSSLAALPTDYKDRRSIVVLATVVTICKRRYNSYAIANGKTLSSCPENDQAVELLQILGQDTRNELRDLVDQDKFATLVYHDSLRDPNDLWKTEEQNRKAAQDSFEAFACDYQGDAHSLLVDTMDYYIQHQPLYRNMCMPIVQSSGHGKSRMVQQASLLRFALPFNLREDLPPPFVAYPPPDTKIRDHFLSFQHLPTDEVKQRFMIFFQALFVEVTAQLLMASCKGESIQSDWYRHLNAGETPVEVGISRTTLYNRVVRLATLISETGPSPASTKASLVRKAKELEAKIHNLTNGGHGKSDTRKKATFFIYFDECHTLTAPRWQEESLYHCLCSAMTPLRDIAIYFITISTNSKLAVKSPTSANIPSLRQGEVQDNSKKLIPPFTELPFDIFAGNVEPHLPLSEYADPKNFRNFGRPLWLCERNDEIAEQKLLVGGRNDKLLLACLAILIHLEFDSKRESAHTLESCLVESYMRVAFAVPEHREYMRTGYPSEPFLVEAAAKVLGSGKTPFAMLAPRLLADTIQAGFTARGERGEVVTRLLYIIARHQVFVNNSAVDFSAIFHTPIKLVDFILALAPKRYHDKILQAKPTMEDDENPAPTFAIAFEHAYVNFTHFQLGGEFDLIKHCYLWKFLRRSMALQCCDNQKQVDNAIPVFFGDPTTNPVTDDASSSMLNQTKNRKQAGEVFVHPSIAEVKSSHPILTLIMDHGCSPDIAEDRWEISDTRSGGTGIHKRHYRFVIHGCDSDTYAVIPKDANPLYRSILAETSAMDDFPRLDLERNVFSAKSQMPCLDTINQL